VHAGEGGTRNLGLQTAVTAWMCAARNLACADAMIPAEWRQTAVAGKLVRRIQILNSLSALPNHK
jgi:hypothetical protein